jgi:hypothetical protein
MFIYKNIMEKIFNHLLKISLTNKLIASLLLFTLIYPQFFNINLDLEQAFAYVSTPAVDVNVQVIETGSSPFDANSWNGNGNQVVDAGETNPGNDSSATNNVVRTQDQVTYRVSVNLNGGDANNTRVTLTLNNGTWISLPNVCLTSLPGTTTSLMPISSISTDKKTLICNLGVNKQGSTISFNVVARANMTINDSQLTMQAIATADGGNTDSANANPVIITGSLIDL